MSKKIAIIDFPKEGEETSWFVVKDIARKGDGGLVGCINDHGFESKLIDYRSLNSNKFDPNEFLAVFYASGWTHIKDPKKKEINSHTREINHALLPACEIYDKCVESETPIVAFTHGSEVLAFYTGGNYSPLKGEMQRKKVYKEYVADMQLPANHWLFNHPNNIFPGDIKARECRDYKIDLERSDFKALLWPEDKLLGPVIAVHKKDSDITAVLLMIHPEYDKNLSAYNLMGNIFAKIKYAGSEMKRG